MNSISSDCKHYFRTFHFTDETDLIYMSCSSSDSLYSSNELHVCENNCLNIKIKESLHSNYGLHVWPSAPVLANYIWHNRWKLKGKNILEIGTGTGLISIIASKCGANVVATDSYQSVLNIATENLALNNCKTVEVQKFSWGIFCPFILSLEKVDMILGSDIFYEPKDFENIIVSISYIFKHNPDSEFWCAYENRCSEWNIQRLMEKWDIVCEEIPLSTFYSESTNIADSGLPGLKEIHLFIFRSRKSVCDKEKLK